MPQATSLAAEIETKFDVKSELIASDKGVFEVVVNGENIFSKKQLGRFPENSEILGSLDSLN
ncbi:MAG: Rdx family protein [Candidatus Marinimicrobia bacterium]|nr:Rdx family protein [Candidatus Neomarinimicrobiota bacterium]